MAALPTTPAPAEPGLEFDRQVEALVQTGLPDLLDVKDECLRAMLEPLRDLLPEPDEGAGRIPFVVVVPDAPVAELLAAVADPDEDPAAAATGGLDRFAPLPGLELPAVPYLLVDVDPGTATREQPPAQAAAGMGATGRSPLTLAEGLAVLVCDLGLLRSGVNLALPGSRTHDDRVPALWAAGERPTLGWWAADAASTALGSASCRGRRAP